MTPPTDPRAHQDESQQGGQHYDNGVAAMPDSDELHNPDVAHEHSDVNVRAIILFAAGLTLVGILASVAMWGVFVVLERQAVANDPQLHPMAVPAGQLPPAPRLLTNEPQALDSLRAWEAGTLEAYGWMDREAGVVHVPIAEAKRLILQRGFTIRPEGPVDPSLGTRAPAMGEASSGRAIALPPPPKAAAPPPEAPAAEAKPPGSEGKG